MYQNSYSRLHEGHYTHWEELFHSTDCAQSKSLDFSLQFFIFFSEWKNRTRKLHAFPVSYTKKNFRKTKEILFFYFFSYFFCFMKTNKHIIFLIKSFSFLFTIENKDKKKFFFLLYILLIFLRIFLSGWCFLSNYIMAVFRLDLEIFFLWILLMRVAELN